MSLNLCFGFKIPDHITDQIDQYTIIYQQSSTGRGEVVTWLNVSGIFSSPACASQCCSGGWGGDSFQMAFWETNQLRAEHFENAAEHLHKVLTFRLEIHRCETEFPTKL